MASTPFTSISELSSYYKRTINSNDKCYSIGADQGIHNWLVHSGYLEYVIGSKPVLFRNGEGIVNTLGEIFVLRLYISQCKLFAHRCSEKNCQSLSYGFSASWCY
jgi:hypothetical protein